MKYQKIKSVKSIPHLIKDDDCHFELIKCCQLFEMLEIKSCGGRAKKHTLLLSDSESGVESLVNAYTNQLPKVFSATPCGGGRIFSSATWSDQPRYLRYIQAWGSSPVNGTAPQEAVEQILTEYIIQQKGIECDLYVAMGEEHEALWEMQKQKYPTHYAK